jgi:hypothetical protein
MALTKEQILAADDLSREAIDVPEWGGVVYVRVLTGAERDRFESDTVGSGKKVNMANIRARLAVLCLVDGDGIRLFDDGDVIALGKKSASALSRVFNTAMRLNGMSQSDVEELAKNSGTAPSEDSGTS